ncbi:hypothetical protein LOK49_Contig86G00002 [Camellia lanceoleosa]|nr:hypothetical protein LOK49_Contig86G00002 [Camellia lanceoleosa]
MILPFSLPFCPLISLQRLAEVIKAQVLSQARRHELAMVKWGCRPSNWVKLNTDGSVVPDGFAGARGIDHGDWIMGFQHYIGNFGLCGLTSNWLGRKDFGLLSLKQIL